MEDTIQQSHVAEDASVIGGEDVRPEVDHAEDAPDPTPETSEPVFSEEEQLSLAKDIEKLANSGVSDSQVFMALLHYDKKLTVRNVAQQLGLSRVKLERYLAGDSHALNAEQWMNLWVYLQPHLEKTFPNAGKIDEEAQEKRERDQRNEVISALIQESMYAQKEEDKEPKTQVEDIDEESSDTASTTSTQHTEEIKE